jgi:hypothetical protein
LVLAFALLAYATRLSLTKLYGVRVHWKDSYVPVFYAMVLGAAAFTYHNISYGSLPHLAVLELVFGLTFLGACFWSRVPWIQLVWTMVSRPDSTHETADQLVQP